MTFRTIAFSALIFALLSVGIYWFVTRPTVEEKAVIGFFDQFKHGKYDDAQAYTVGNDFWLAAAKTTVIDSNGAQYTIGDYFPETKKALLKSSVETYVRTHIAKWKYLFMDTQVFSDTESVVHFRIEVGVRDWSSGSFVGETDDGRVEGTAYLKMENGQWKIDRFDLAIFSDQGLDLATYLEQGN
jgi:hypothetical protein